MFVSVGYYYILVLDVDGWLVGIVIEFDLVGGLYC